jgi:hypothetical protein
MAGWITAFKAIPWADVIAAAPVVAQGARKLWTSIRSKGPDAAGARAMESTESRVQALEVKVTELKKELAASSELINSLAEQNARLVQAVGILRIRTRALLAACVAAVAFSAGLGIYVMLA